LNKRKEKFQLKILVIQFLINSITDNLFNLTKFGSEFER